MQNSTAYPMIISESMAISDATLRPLIKNFQEVTTLNHSIWNVLAFSFDLFPTGSASYITDRDIIKLHWETANDSSSEYIEMIDTEGDRDRNLYQGNQTSDGAVRYHFTVRAGELSEGPLRMSLSVKLRCLHYNSHNYCTQWQYERESNTIHVKGKQGKSIITVHVQDT